MAKHEVTAGIVMISILLVRLFFLGKTLFEVVLPPYHQIERPPRHMELQPAQGGQQSRLLADARNDRNALKRWWAFLLDVQYVCHWNPVA